MTWEDFIFQTNSSIDAQSVSAPRCDNVYNEPSIGFYKDGSVWVSGAKGTTRIFKNCPYDLMLHIYLQRFAEVKKTEESDDY